MKFRSLRNIPRIQEMTSIFVRHGLQTFAEQLGMPALDRLKGIFRPRRQREDASGLSLATRLRNVLQELGPTYVKLGQVLSTRHDLVGAEFVEEFQKLQDDVPPMPFEEVTRILEQEYGKKPDEVFASFERVPLGAASIGQVHRAVTLQGDEVVLKVQRAGIHETIRSDIDILYSIAQMLKDNEVIDEVYDPVEIVDEFSRAIRHELDYVREASNIRAFRKNFKDDPTVHVPRVFGDLSTGRVLCMEFIHGTKASRLDPDEFDLEEVALRGARAVLQQVFLDGCFHADPHPGNIIVMPGNVVSFVDFGMIGRLSTKMRDQISQLLLALVAQDYDQIARQLLFMSDAREDVDLDEFAMAIMDTIDPYYGLPLRKINIGGLLKEMLEQVAKYRIKFPPNYSLMMKSLITIENLGKRLYPDFDMLQEARPFVERLVLERWKPQRLKKDVLQTLRDTAAFLERTPLKVDRILSKMQRGTFGIEFRHRGLAGLTDTLDKIGNRLSFSLVISALIIGSSFIIASSSAQTVIFGVPIGKMLYLLAGVLGLGLAASIIRSGKL